MSYYCVPDYWEYGYAVGDPITGSVAIPLSISLSGSGVFLVSANSDIAITSASNVEGTKILLGASLIAANTNMAIVGGYTKFGVSEISATFNVSSSANFTTGGGLTIDLASGISVIGGYTRSMSATIPISCIIAVIGREKWEQQSVPSEIWTQVG